ncbi:unnamed protein product [Camellia sinensis]
MANSPSLKIAGQALHQFVLLQQALHQIVPPVTLQIRRWLFTEACSTSSEILRGVNCCLLRCFKLP